MIYSNEKFKKSYYLSMGALCVMVNSSTYLSDMMKDPDFDENTRKFIARRLMEISFRAM